MGGVGVEGGFSGVLFWWSGDDGWRGAGGGGGGWMGMGMVGEEPGEVERGGFKGVDGGVGG